MIIDDEKVILESTEAYLIDYGYKVSCYTNPEKALNAFKKNPNRYDLVMTDMTMPEMTGETLAKNIKAIRPGLPIILCTGYSEDMSEEKALGLGINRFLQKPIISQPIAEIIREVIDSH